jgi:hypothetical protein
MPTSPECEVVVCPADPISPMGSDRFVDIFFPIFLLKDGNVTSLHVIALA